MQFTIGTHLVCILQISHAITFPTARLFLYCWSPTLLSDCADSVIKFWSFGKFTPNPNSTLVEDVQLLNGLITIIDRVFYIWAMLVEMFGQTLILLCIFDLLNATKTFTTTLSADSCKNLNLFKVRRKHAEQILSQWRKLKLLSNSINDVTDGLVFVFWILATSYLSGSFDRIARNSGWLKKVANVEFMLVVGTIFGVAPKICEEVSEIFWSIFENIGGIHYGHAPLQCYYSKLPK